MIFALFLKSFPTSHYIDEFDAFATESFSTFLNKGRSSEFMIHLAHQTLSDLNCVGPEFAGQILGNCNVRFIFRQDDPDDAERWSRFLGTSTVIKRTFRSKDGTNTGDSSNREALEFIIPPDQIKSLKIGHCIFSMKTEGVTHVLRVPFFSPVKCSNIQIAPAVPATRGIGTKQLSDLKISGISKINNSPQPEETDEWATFQSKPKEK